MATGSEEANGPKAADTTPLPPTSGDNSEQENSISSTTPTTPAELLTPDTRTPATPGPTLAPPPTPATPVEVTTTAGDEVAVKHPLQNNWQFWYFKADRKQDWEANLLKVAQFKTVEDFWALYNHIELASKLGIGCDYNLFKFGIRPMWEDQKNKKGGRWLFTLQKNKQNSRFVDELWLEVLLCLVGEAFGSDSDQICGAVINIRKQMDKISVWTSDFKNTASVMNIGRILKQRTGFQGPVCYEAHEDTQVKHGSAAKHMYQI